MSNISLKYSEYKSSPEFKDYIDTYCMHCLAPFLDGDEIGRCEQTRHLTHAECTKHDP